MFRLVFWVFLIILLFIPHLGMKNTPWWWSLLLISFFLCGILHDGCRLLVWHLPQIELTSSTIGFRRNFGLQPETINIHQIESIDFRKRINSTPLVILRYHSQGNQRSRMHVVWINDFNEKSELLAVFSSLRDASASTEVDEQDTVR
jgi:hypothetical protein